MTFLWRRPGFLDSLQGIFTLRRGRQCERGHVTLNLVPDTKCLTKYRKCTQSAGKVCALTHKLQFRLAIFSMFQGLSRLHSFQLFRTGLELWKSSQGFWALRWLSQRGSLSMGPEQDGIHQLWKTRHQNTIALLSVCLLNYLLFQLYI